ncbi:MAG TPA: TlpA disulfide reductase family protein [Nitrososphaerales archaeon]
MTKTLLLAIVGIIVVGAIGGLFLLNSTQQQVSKDVMVKDVSKEQAMQKEPPQAMAKEAFTLRNVNGDQISLAELQKSGKPVLIYFFATWCPVCEKDLRSLNSTYQKYQGKIEVVVVGFDPTETSEQISQYRQSRGYMWAFAEYNKDALLHFKIITQSTKIGLDAKGNEIFRDGYGVLSGSDWAARLDKLLA